MVKVSVIIPNWNGKDLLEVCLGSLIKQSFKDFEVLVIDNGSDDNSVEFIKKNYPKVKIIELDKNYGFATAVNIGIKKTNTDLIMLLNNDTKLDKKTIGYLVQAIDNHPEVGIVSPKMLNFFNPEVIDNAGVYINAVAQADNIGRGEKDDSIYNKEGYIFLNSGGGSLYKREVFKKIGFFDEDFFAYYEDVDFGLRAQYQGIKIWYEPKAVIYHIHKATTSMLGGFGYYLQFRNMMQTLIKDIPTEVLAKDFNWLKAILVNINTLRFLLNKGFFWWGIKAEWYVLINMRKILSKRYKIQSKINVEMKDITQNFRRKSFLR